MAICSHRDKTKLKRAKEQRTEERKLKKKQKKKQGKVGGVLLAWTTRTEREGLGYRKMGHTEERHSHEAEERQKKQKAGLNAIVRMWMTY